jgi:hypothetical protein
MTNNSAGTIGNIRKKCHETFELISTSYHEAGHTVYGLLHLIKIESVSVFENKKSKRIEGFTHYDSASLEQFSDPELFSERLHAEIGLSYSGLVAEKRHFKMVSGSDKFPMFLRDGSSNDTTSAAALFQKYNLVEAGKKRYNYKQRFIKTVDQELQEHWDAVTLVAHGLIKKKKIYFPELQEILTRKTEDKQFWKDQFKAINYFYNNAEHLDEKDIKCILSL